MTTVARIRTTAAALRPFPAAKRGRNKDSRPVMNYDSLFVFIPNSEN